MTTRAATVHRIFLVAAELTGAEREQCLREQCGGDDALRAEVQALLQYDTGGSFLAEDRLAGVRASLQPDESPPERIGSFRILEVLGRGGMGVVYRAAQDQPAREVALKVLAPGAGGPETRARFALEAEALGRLQHPGIAQIHEAGTYASPHGDRPFLAMELVRGEPLHTWVRQHAPPLARRVALWAELCLAVHHAHQKGVIHRDLKPSNVLVDADGRIKVLDFGIARLVDADRVTSQHTHPGQLLGTLAYMSPEQANGTAERVDVRTDVYSLGAIGYELLCGEPPLATLDELLTQALRRIVEQDPLPLGDRDRHLRGDLQTIAEKALRKEPGRRYASALALADDLRRHLAHEPILARPATATYVVRRFARRHRGLVAGLAIALVALVGGTIVSIAWALRAERAEATAKQEAGISNRVTELLRNLFLGASPETAAGRNPTAKEILATGRVAVDRERAADPFGTARISLILGEVFVALGDTEAGDSWIQGALDALRARFSGDDDRLVEALHVRAWSLVRAGRFAEAGPLYAEALAMHRRTGRVSDITEAKCLEGLATVAARTGEPDQALALLAQARPLRERANDPLRLAAHWQNVAVTNLIAKRYDAADAAFANARAALPTRGNEAFTAVIATNLGNLRLRQQRLPEAETEFRQALALGETAFGKDSVRLVLPLAHVGTICAQTGRDEEAETLLRRAIELGGDETKSSDAALVNALCNLGKLCAQQERFEEAAALWTRAEGMEQRLHPGTPGHLNLLEDLAHVRAELGDEAGATACRERAAKLRPQGK